MRTDLLQLAASLARAGDVFALATVVRREPASSAQVGNMALITERGEFHGWLGGSCIQPSVVREALAAIRAGNPRLISLSPDPTVERRTGVTAFPMTCHSGGSVDIYVEPVLPAPRLVVFGLSPIAQALARLGKAMGYRIDAVDRDADAKAFPEADRVIVNFVPDEYQQRPESEKGRVFAIVVTLGHRDEDAAWDALSIEPVYLGVVASRTRFAHIRAALMARGAAAAAVDRIRNPAGLDIGARSPEEIALSILAEIVQLRQAAAEGLIPSAEAASAELEEPALVREERDPVCGMIVNIATATHRVEHDGRTYYFCCGGCRARFLETPARYAAALLS
jgi:xanthine dehydrogenase accessory factor